MYLNTFLLLSLANISHIDKQDINILRKNGIYLSKDTLFFPRLSNLRQHLTEILMHKKVSSDQKEMAKWCLLSGG